ncbi:MAG: tRNA pseudouridine(55) synthase TruB [Tissierellia bacterium]|nr:tRNA pseudouridine(55) synthase TruB [Tissierellia bacterium]
MKLTGVKFDYGVINVFKEDGFTSHDVVQVLRRILGLKRIGHTGTLDPAVKGVLPICIGNATRVAEYIQNQGKTYKGVMKLGIKTDTLDMSGRIISESDFVPDMIDIIKSADEFQGEIEQIPPMYSAVHHNGMRLHELARSGIVVKRKPRKVEIYNFEILSYDYPYISFVCKCSKGTYIRTLVDDLGENLNTFAALYHLERTEVGNLKIEDSIDLKKIEKMVGIGDYSFIIPMDLCLNMPKIIIDDGHFNRIINGIKIKIDIKSSDNLYRIYCKNKFIGIGKSILKDGGNYLKLEKMLYQERR